MERHTYYIIYHLDTAIDDLESGWYKYTFALSEEIQVSNACEHSLDRLNWTSCDKFKSLQEFQEFFENIEPKPMKIENNEYIETISYRGLDVPIFFDDYGQCFFCTFNNKEIAFGSFQDNYEDEVKALIDLEVDKR